MPDPPIDPPAGPPAERPIDPRGPVEMVAAEAAEFAAVDPADLWPDDIERYAPADEEPSWYWPEPPDDPRDCPDDARLRAGVGAGGGDPRPEVLGAGFTHRAEARERCERADTGRVGPASPASVWIRIDRGRARARIQSHPERARTRTRTWSQPDRVTHETAESATIRAGVAGGFAAGAPLDLLPPDPVLAGFVEEAFDGGLHQVTDDELVGMLCAAHRLASWQAGVELAAVAELDARRRAQARRAGSSQVGEHVSEELAAALALTARSADAMLGLAREFARIPAVRTGMLSGRIDRARAEVFASELSGLGDIAAAAVAAAFRDVAASMTTGQLRAALRAMVLEIDPDAARRRAERGRAEARVEAWQESSGNGALAGRELPAAEMIAADKRIDAIARTLRAAGVPGNLEQIRAMVFTALLTGRDPATLVPAAPGAAEAPDSRAAGGEPRGPRSEPAESGSTPGGETAPADRVPADRVPADRVPADRVPADRVPADRVPAAPAPSAGNTGGRRPAAPDARPAGGAAAPFAAWPMSWSGTVNLTLPLATWLGWSDAPGDAAGFGPLAGPDCRDLADRLTTGPNVRWCLTLTGPDGRAVGHACARAGPAAMADPADGRPAAGDAAAVCRAPVMEWLAGLRIRWLERDNCRHPLQTAAYRPGAPLRHLIKIRQRTCAFPGCRWPARACDDDHTVPFEDGGRTCECNLAPLCRRHHQAKQAVGWHLDQPQPGVLVWTMPSGRTYTTRPTRYGPLPTGSLPGP
ncbi:MAG: hypothetical protein ACYCO9_20005 [Streptosporangiaceae bacterium]